MVQRALQKLSSQGAYLAKEARAYAAWAVPGAVGAGWFVWPGLTPAFKEEALGIKTPPAPGSAAATAASGSPNWGPSGKYKYVRNEIGERPTLEDE